MGPPAPDLAPALDVATRATPASLGALTDLESAAGLAALADLLARHAVLLLCVLAALLLAASFVAWRLLQRVAPRLFAAAARAWHVVDRRRFAARYLGVHAVVSFALAAGGVAAFFELAEEIGAGDELAAFDLALAAALSRHLDAATLAAFGAITHLGDPLVLWSIGLVVAVVLAWRGERLLAGGWVAVVAGGALLNWLLKKVFERSRPVHDHGFASADGFSFPSGHASGALLVYGTLAYLVLRHTPARWHLPAAALALVLVVFVGASRVLLQVHWFSDVLAGWANAAAWATLCIGGLEAVRLATSSRPD
jgi:undecaprenyl-diphosphatase